MNDASIVHDVSSGEPGVPDPLFGRTAEQDAIASMLAGARSGSGGALLIHGEAGLGVTALLSGTAITIGFTVLTTGGRRREADLPFAAMHRLLRPIAAVGGATTPVRRLARAAGRGDRAARLDLSIAVLELLCTTASGQPVLCCVDDAQWMDPVSQDVLAFVATRITDEPVALLAGTHGPDLVPDLPCLRLGPLDADASRALLAHRLPDDLAGDVAGTLVALCAGNPRALVEVAGSLTPQQRRGDAPPPASLPADSALRRAYRGRLDELPERSRWLLLLASADPSLDADELVRAAARAGTDLGALEPAERAGLVRVSDGAVVFPEPLVRMVVYDEASLHRRAAAHAILADLFDPCVQPLRHHLHAAATGTGPTADRGDALERAAHGADHEAASRALERAAEISPDPDVAAARVVAAARHAWLGGQPHRARILLHRLGSPSVPRVRAQADLLLGEIELRSGAAAHAGQALLAAAGDLDHDRHLRVNAMMQAGEAMCLSGEYGTFADVARRALRLRRPPEPPATQLMFDQFTGLTAMFTGDYAAGVPALRRVLSAAHRLDDPSALIRASMAAIVLGDDLQAYRLAMRAADAARRTGDQVAVPRALELASAAECALGRYQAAWATSAQALPLARATGQDGVCSTLLGLQAVLAATVGDRGACLARIDEARSHTNSHGVSRSEALVEWAMGVLELVEGRPAEAVARLAGLMSLETGHGQLVIRVAATPHLVEAAVRAGDRPGARRALMPFDVWAQNTGNPAWLALDARCHALVTDDESESEKHFAEALRHHLAAEADFERARTELLYGQELRRVRRPGAAREHLRTAVEILERFRAFPLVRQARAELRAAGELVGRDRPVVTDVLTAQQLRIARLAADGATNREVAAALFLSIRTVDYHMRNIFTRLGIRSRVDLAKRLT
jgi:DNA-binding CsgD family transcriptional regulator